jgi:hypothetical protein
MNRLDMRDGSLLTHILQIALPLPTMGSLQRSLDSLMPRRLTQIRILPDVKTPLEILRSEERQ